MAQVALALVVAAALGGITIFAHYHLKKVPLPIPIVLGHGLLALAGLGLLWVSKPLVQSHPINPATQHFTLARSLSSIGATLARPIQLVAQSMTCLHWLANALLQHPTPVTPHVLDRRRRSHVRALAFSQTRSRNRRRGPSAVPALRSAVGLADR